MEYPLVKKAQLNRYPIYLHYLILKRNSNVKYISPTDISKDLKLSKEAIRKDFQAVSKEEGIRKKGREINQLISDIEEFLGLKKHTKAILIGAGNIGKAILSFKGFSNYSISIVAAYDKDPKVIGTKVNNIPIYDIKDLKKDNSIGVAIIAVPSEQAQSTADLVIKNGIKAIYNLSPVYLVAGDDVIIETLDIASSIAYLLRKLKLRGDTK